jgi:hypothetical protein
MATESLNRRKDDRYLIDEIPLEGIGTIVEISKNGLKIKKDPGFNPETPGFNPEALTLTFTIFGLEITSAVRWQDKNFLGLQSTITFTDPSFFIRRIKQAEEILAPAQKKVLLENTLAHYKKDEGLSPMINLLMEMDCSEPSVRKIGWFINEISILEEKEKPSGIKDGEESAKDGVQEVGGEEGKTIKEELIDRVINLKSRSETGQIDVDFALFILGLSKVCEIIKDHINKKFFQSETTLPLFENYETFNILKSVVFKNLCHFFGLQGIQTEGSTLLSLETTGVDLLIKESNGILDSYYKSPSRLYSEISRTYEKAFFALDHLQVNQHYFIKGLKTFGELFNGYVLAHHTLNPHYFSSEDLKISLSKNGLIFSSLVCLTFLAIQFLLDKNRESGFALAKRLKGRGMDDRKIDQFLDQSVGDTKTILGNLKLRGNLSKPSLPDGLIPVERYLGRDIRFEYLIQSFRHFDRGQVKRMALRYEDAVYAHFILGKLLISESFNLNSKTVCVVPCGNISSDQWYIKDFDYFNLIVFKEIHKLPASHLNTFLKLWGSFEGQIIATFSHLVVLDYTNPPMHKIFNNYLVDFPSYFLNDAVYGKMIDHTFQYLQPYLGDQSIDRNRYLSGVFTMNHIKTDILMTKKII